MGCCREMCEMQDCDVIQQMEREQEALDSSHFSLLVSRLGPFDVTVRLAADNMRVGLQKMSWLLDSLGRDHAVAFVATPDFSVTRHPLRWRAGFAYGGLLVWHSEIPIQFPELRPNGCGVLLGELSGEVSCRSFTERVQEGETRYSCDWDYGSSNHYIGVYSDQGRTFVILHGGCRKYKADNDELPGMYPENSEWLKSKLQHQVTPYGTLAYLQNRDAMLYYEFCMDAQKRIMERREELGKFLFPGIRKLFHHTHQGFYAPNCLALGCYLLPESCSEVPIMVTSGGALLMAGNPPTVDALLRECLSKGLAERLVNALPVDIPRGLSPHGSGDVLLIESGNIAMEGPGYGRQAVHAAQRAAVSPWSFSETHRSEAEAEAALTRFGMRITRKLTHMFSVDGDLLRF